MPWDDNLDPASAAYGIASAQSARVRVMAGPGTGKSFAMKRRVARLLETGVAPQEILAVTFTRVAAEDLHRELVGMGVPGCDALEGQTLHSLGLKVLSRQHVLEALGRTPRPLNGFEERTLICDLEGAFGGIRDTEKLLDAYNAAWAQAQGDTPGYPAGSQEEAFAQAVLRWMHFHRAMLIGEIVPYFLVYLTQNPLAAERNEFRHILVDEYQDLNKAEQTIVDLLSGGASECIVGDDDQSIYSFKFANPEGIRDWHLVNANTQDFGLDDCHRCPATVVAMANALIGRNANRVPRQLVSMPEKGPGAVRIIQYPNLDAEIAFITEEVNRLIGEGIPPGDIIVLIQRKLVGKLVYNSMTDALIPVKSYYEESELDSELAQERFALFKLLLDRSDRVALRFLLGRGHNRCRATFYRRLRDHCEQNAMSPWDTLEALENQTLQIANTNALVQRFAEIKAAITALEPHQNDVAALLNALFPATEAETFELRALALELLAGEDAPTDASELLGQMLTRITKPEVPATVHQVRIMSLHKSKGLSSPVVFIGGCSQGLLPRMPDPNLPFDERVAAIEEQRRLFYVGVTRVKADPGQGKPGRLYLTYSQSMPAGLARRCNIPGFHQYGVAQLQPSMFVAEFGAAAPPPIAG